MRHIADEFLGQAKAQEKHGMEARRVGSLDLARRYFARAEIFAFCAGTIAREIGDAKLTEQADGAQSLNMRRALSQSAAAID